MKEIIAQIIGVLGFITIVSSFQSNKRKHILLLQLFGSMFFAVHFFLIGSMTGSAMNAIGIFRAYIFNMRLEKKWANNIFFMYFFIFCFAVAGILTWENPLSLFPTIAMIINTIGLWMKNPRKIRIISLIASPCWLVYNIWNDSIPGALTETFVTSSIIIAIIRFEFLNKSKDKE